jgi:hypothetical protein
MLLSFVNLLQKQISSEKIIIIVKILGGHIIFLNKTRAHDVIFYEQHALNRRFPKSS